MAITCPELNPSCPFNSNKVATNLIVSTPEQFIRSTATSLRIHRPTQLVNGLAQEILIPCAGFIQFGECCCDNEEFEIASYNGVDDSVPGEYTLLNMVRNLSRVGNATTSIGAPSEHISSVKIVIGSVGIHYYYQQLADTVCQYITTARTVYNSLQSLPTATGSGQLAIVKNGNQMQIYVDTTISSVNQWIGQSLAIQQAGVGQLGTVSLKQPGSSVVYNVGSSTKTALDIFYDTSSNCNNTAISTTAAIIPINGVYVKREIEEISTAINLVSSNVVTEILLYSKNIVSTLKNSLFIDFNILRKKTNTTLNYKFEILDSSSTVIYSAVMIGADTDTSIRDVLKFQSTVIDGNQELKIYAVKSSSSTGTIQIQRMTIDIQLQPQC